MGTLEAWRDILEVQPERFQRVLMCFPGGVGRIGSYDPYDYRFWGVEFWKPINDDGHSQQQAGGA